MGVDELFTDDIQSYYNSADLNATAEAEVCHAFKLFNHNRKREEGSLSIAIIDSEI